MIILEQAQVIKQEIYNNRFTHFKSREEYHNTYHCKCSFCKTERNLTEKIKTIAYPARYKAQIEKQKLKYLRSERNLVR